MATMAKGYSMTTGPVRVMSTLPILQPIIEGAEAKKKGDGRATEQNSTTIRGLKQSRWRNCMCEGQLS